MSDALEQVLEEIRLGELAPIYLLVGEEFLVRQAADDLVKLLLPDPSPGLNFTILDGAGPREVAQDLATLPMFPGRKIVLVRDPEFLAPKKGRGDALGKAREAWRAGRRKEGARRLLAVAARAGWGVAELDPTAPGAPGVEAWRDELNVELAEADLAFLKEAAVFCRQEGISAPESDATALVELFGKGLPRGQVLVVVASELDAKHPLVKVAQKHGRILERKVAAKLKDLDIGDLARHVLGPYQKRLAPAATTTLKDRVGGNMRLMQSELEKLAQYTDGPVIEATAVELLVHHAREEEFLELSDAVQKRDLQAALRYAEEAMGQGAHPLLLLGSIASIVRTLLANCERLHALSGGRPPRSFDEFKSRIFPLIEEEAKAAKQRVPHPYAAFMGMQAAARYTREELLGALVACAESDLALKLSGSGTLVIERLLWTLCGRMAPWESGMHVVRRDTERT